MRKKDFAMTQPNLQSIPMFQCLDHSQISHLEKISRFKEFSQGSYVFLEGEPSENLHILLKGRVKVYKTSPSGQEFILHLFTPVVMIAECPTFSSRPFPATAQALEGSTILLIDFEKMKSCMIKNPDLCFAMIRSLTQKIQVLESYLCSNVMMDATSRLARWLYRYEEEFFKIRNGELAGILGITPETFSRVLKKLKKEGLYFDKNKMRITNKELLLEFFEESQPLSMQDEEEEEEKI